MNTRIRVEHPVTDMVSGQDPVAMRLRLTAGRLPATPRADIASRGHAIECRLMPKTPTGNSFPRPGR